jgi:MFS family permease
MTYCVDVITADSSRLKNRGLAYAFTSSPYIITAFAGPKASEDSLNSLSWRWAFGIFAIILPLVASPLFFVLQHNLPRMTQPEEEAVEGQGREALAKRIWTQMQEYDIVGALLFSCGLVILFLPFDIASEAPKGWASGYIIAMIVVGLALLISFGLYEAYLAPKPMTPRWMLKNKTLIGACLLDATYQISYYCWANYFTSFLQVVNNLSITTAGYVSNTFDVVSGILLILVGFAIRRTGRFKWLLYIAVPLYVFAQGLMIYFRRPNQNVGYLVMCQVFISIGGSVFIIVEQLAALAAVDHEHVAVALALLNVVGTVGGAIGATISGAIWTHTFYEALQKFLPQDVVATAIDDIYDSLDTQLSYEVGSPVRLAIQHAYAFAQTRMLAAGTCIMCLAFAWTLLIKNIDVGSIKQVKGTVF